MTGRRGFSLVELLFAMIIIGILTGVAFKGLPWLIRRMWDTRLKDGLATLYKSEEAYFAQYDTFADDATIAYVPDHPDTRVLVYDITSTGFHAKMWSANAWQRECYLAYGDATPLTYATTVGTPGCKP